MGAAAAVEKPPIAAIARVSSVAEKAGTTWNDVEYGGAFTDIPTMLSLRIG